MTMIAPNLCEQCKKPIMFNKIEKDGKLYHARCLNGPSAPTLPNLMDENEQKKFTHERRKTVVLKMKYTDNYFNKSILTEVVRPYLQFKYKIKKNAYLELIPQYSLYFQDITEKDAEEFIKNGGLKKFKKELQELLGDDYTININSIVVGSILTKFRVFAKKIKAAGEKAANKIKNFFSKKDKETELIKSAMQCIETHSFKSIKDLKPNAVKFVNQSIVENKTENEKKIKEFLEEKIGINFDAKSNWYNDSYETDDNISEENLDNIFADIKAIAENEEKELEIEMENVKINENFNLQLKKDLENVFKESIFEYRITGLVVINNDKSKNEYEKEKNNCPNCETKILFHATQIKYGSKILTSNFIVGKDNYYGMGVYFGDQLDYVKYYYKKDDNDQTNLCCIPKINDSFSIIVSEVYYDKSNFRQIYNFDLHKVIDYFPNKQQLNSIFKKYTVPKNSIHYIEVEGDSTYVINENKIVQDINIELPKDRFVGREYCVTCDEQIYPLYGLNYQRVDYCIIWRDSNFNSPYWKDSLEKNKLIIKEMTGYNLYTESDTQSALKLVWRKKYNKIILITNVGANLEGKKFVDKVRKILKFNVVVLFFTNDFNHLNWIKDYPNSLFCMDDYTIKNYVFNFNENGLNEIRNNIKEFYGVELQEIKNAMDYPLYEKFKEDYHLYSEIDCSEYKDTDD